MVPDRIKELLDKYWRAETDEAEERELKEYFTGKPGLEGNPVGSLFNYFKEEQEITIADGFEERLETAITRKTGRMHWLNPFLKIAAALLIVFSIVYILLPERKLMPIADKDSDTFKDPEKAYLETKKALLLISKNLNTGNSYISEIGKINRAEELINTKAEKK
jgi:hypothetical protein